MFSNLVLIFFYYVNVRPKCEKSNQSFEKKLFFS